MTVDEILEDIKHKLYSVDDLLGRVAVYTGDAEKLSVEEKKSITIFPNDWSEAGVRKYIEEFERAIKDPIRYKNKKKLEEFGINTEGISDTILGDTVGVESVLSLYKELRSIGNYIIQTLNTTKTITNWLREGIEFTKSKLEEMINAEAAFKRILESKIDDKLRSEIIKRSFGNIYFLTEAESLISQYSFIDNYSINLEFLPEFEYNNYSELVKTVGELIQLLTSEFGIQVDTISELVSNKGLAEVNNILDVAYSDYDKKKRGLIIEWSIYSSALKSLGEDVQQAPKNLDELVKDIQDLNRRLMKYLGDTGIKLLNYIKGEDSFPSEVTLDEVKKALETMRPFLSKSLIGGG